MEGIILTNRLCAILYAASDQVAFLMVQMIEPFEEREERKH